MKRTAITVEVAAAAAFQLALAELLKRVTDRATVLETRAAELEPVLLPLPLQREPQAAGDVPVGAGARVER